MTLHKTLLAVAVSLAFAGAAVASVAVFVLGSVGRGGPTPVTLALAGSAISALLADPATPRRLARNATITPTVIAKT